MRRILFILLTCLLVFGLVSCGGNDEPEEPKEYEIAMIADSNEIEDGSFTQAVWTSVESFAKNNGIVAACLKTEKADEDNQDEAEVSYMESIDKAVESKAKLIVMSGSNFETTVYEAQSKYPDIYFLLIDGVPHDPSLKYATTANTVSIVFAEEEAGYLAGYAAVKEGYKKLGFMGGEELPTVKRYGHGFVQGAAAAAAELEKKVEMTYIYTGTFDPSEDIQKRAAAWYKNGIEVIFACGGGIGTSIMKAAENNDGEVIGVDVDQSYMSDTVVTSAKKNISVVIEEMLENYIDERFTGGTAFNYAAKNGGVSLELDNAKFSSFTEDDYNKVFRQLKNGKIQLKKDTGVSTVKELTGEWLTITIDH